jgi:flagellar hook protein FlgE
MFPAFSIALSALKADSTAIDVTGNNLANLNTTGFKASSADFQDLMSQSIGVAASPAQVGMGVGQLLTSTNYTQGTLTTTNGPTDVAIQGNGFFVVKDQSNQTLYTRDGSFQVDASGNLTTATGQYVQGWSAVNGVVNPNGPTSNITIPQGGVTPASATTTMSMDVNLNSQVATTDPGANFSAPIQVIDGQGASHTLSVNFTKTATNTWGYTVTIPASDLKSGGTTTLATGTMTFDGNGNLTSPAQSSDPQSIKIAGLANGASDMSINWNLYNPTGASTMTQLAEASGVTNPAQNGTAAGQITNVSIQNGGLVVANYSNGAQTTIGQLGIASINNPESLLSVSDNNLQASASTAPISVGAANTVGRGQIVAGSLETSTVDMATEFTNLLTYERSYQAASRVITTSDQLLQETVNLIHP